MVCVGVQVDGISSPVKLLKRLLERFSRNEERSEGKQFSPRSTNQAEWVVDISTSSYVKGLCWMSDTELYVAGYKNLAARWVVRYTVDTEAGTSEQTWSAADVADLTYDPIGVACAGEGVILVNDASGNLYKYNTLENTIREYSNGDELAEAGTGTEFLAANSKYVVVGGLTGSLYMFDHTLEDVDIHELTNLPAINSIIAGSREYSVLTEDNTLYVQTLGFNNLFYGSITEGTVTEIKMNFPFVMPAGFDLTPDDHILIADPYISGSIVIYDQSRGEFVTDSTGAAATLQLPAQHSVVARDLAVVGRASGSPLLAVREDSDTTTKISIYTFTL